MTARTSRRIARAIRQTKKGAHLGVSLAKAAGSAAKLGISSGVVLAHRGPILAAAIASPASANATEIQRMGSEKALAAFSAETSIFSNLMSAQLAWMKFGLVQARLGGMAFEGFVRARSKPLMAGQIIAETAEKALANTMDAAMNLSHAGQAVFQQALRPFQKAVSANAVRLARQ